MKKGKFCTINEIKTLDDEDTDLNADKVEADFCRGEILPPHLISDILMVIDECFIKKLMKDDRLIAKFGSLVDSYTKAINEYKVEVLNSLAKWQTKYEANHGELGINLQGRVAYTLRYDEKGNAPQPLLTFSYILALDMIFKHIPNSIREVCVCYCFIFSHVSIYEYTC